MLFDRKKRYISIRGGSFRPRGGGISGGVVEPKVTWGDKGRKGAQKIGILG